MDVYYEVSNNILKNKHNINIVVTHRYELINKFDKVIFIDNNGAVNLGTHCDIYKSCEQYRKLIDEGSKINDNV